MPAEPRTLPLTVKDAASDGSREIVGLLLVHGIGSQRRGTVVSASTDALAAWLSARVGERAQVVDARLRPTDPAVTTPAHARLQVDNFDCLIAESRWADAFIAPSYGTILPWTVVSVLRTVHHDVRELLRARPRVTSGALTEQCAAQRAGFATYRPGETSVVFRHVKAAVLLALIVPVLLVLVLATLLSVVPPLRTMAVRIQSVMSATIGDSYMFVTAPTARAAVINQVHVDLAWLAGQQPDRILVAAHSQGAAVALEALRSLGPDVLPGTPIDLVTYGSGARKLENLRGTRDHDRGGVRRALLVLSGALLLAAGALFITEIVVFPLRAETSDARLIASYGILLSAPILTWAALLAFWLRAQADPRANDGESGFDRRLTTNLVVVLASAYFLALLFVGVGGQGTIIVTALALVGYAIALAVCLRDPNTPAAVSGPARVGRWLDVLASADPVSGPPPAPGDSVSLSDPTAPVPLVVHNFRSAAFDHSTYWANWSEFVPVILNVLAADSPTGRSIRIPEFWLRRERSRRYEVTYLLVSLRVVAALFCAIVVLAALRHLDAIGDFVLEQAIALLNRIPGEVYREPAGRFWDYLVGVLVVVSAFALVYWFVAAIWNWHQERSRDEHVSQLRAWDQFPDVDMDTWLAACPATLHGSDGGLEPISLVLMRGSGSAVVLAAFDDSGQLVPGWPRPVSRDQLTLKLRVRLRIWLRLRIPGTGVDIWTSHTRSLATLVRTVEDPDHR